MQLEYIANLLKERIRKEKSRADVPEGFRFRVIPPAGAAGNAPEAGFPLAAPAQWGGVSDYSWQRADHDAEALGFLQRRHHRAFHCSAKQF